MHLIESGTTLNIFIYLQNLKTIYMANTFKIVLTC